MRSSVNDIAKDLIKIGAAITAGLGFAGKTLIDVGAKTESLKLRMSSLLGSVAEGNRVFKDMSDFAGKVPFAYEDIMEASTQLSGVLKGGAAEIKATMPMIADLAAVSGLSIQQTTDQVSRMYSAGAGAADLFREKGINAMLGFKSGVAVSAEETKKKLIEAFEDPASKFRGAANKLATTWEGTLSMIGDKWFQMRSTLAEAGVFNYFKSIAHVINDLFGQALDNTKKNAESWSNSIIDGIRYVIDAVGFLADMFRGLSVVWSGLKALFANFITFLLENLQKAHEGLVGFINMIPGIDIEPVALLGEAVLSLKNVTADLNKEFDDMLMKEMPSEKIEAFKMKVEETFIKLQELSAVANEQISSVTEGFVEKTDETLIHLQERTDEWLTGLRENSQTFVDSFFTMVDSTVNSLAAGIAGVITEGKSLADTFKNIAKQVLAQFITMLVKMGIQRMILAVMNKGANTSEAAAGGAKAVALAGANMFASWAGAPWPISLGAPVAAAAAVAGATASLAAGAAAGGSAGATIGGAFHGGTDFVPKEASFLLDKGERVLSPTQNRDLTSFLSEGGGRGVTVTNLNVHIMENATNADSFFQMDEFQIREIVAGPIIKALDTLNDQGIRPVFAERAGE